MRLKNKGYTLVELLLSIAIFSIVMVGIASIMSSTLKAYSSANIDVTVQEDCQIAANQIEELLCDASSISAYDPSVGWIFKDDDGPYYDKAISYDGSTVILKELVAGAGYIPHTIAEDVTSFSIDNWKADSNVTVSTEKAYNQVVINMTMDKNGTTYSLKRNVYFRNDVENDSFHSINNLMGDAGTAGPTPGSGEIEFTVKRFEKYNLTAENRIRYNCKLYKKNGAAWDLITDPGAGSPTDNGFFKLEKASDSPTLSSSFSGASTYYLSTGANVNGNFDTTVAGTYKVEGFRDSAGSEKVVLLLNVDAVDILGDDVVVQQHESNTVNEEGFSSPINVKGININEALKNGMGLSFKYNLSRSGTVIGPAWSGDKSISACTDGIINYNSYMPGQYNFGSERISIGLAPDPFNGGLTVVGNNENMSTCASLKGDKNLNISFNIVMSVGSYNKTFNETFKFTGLSTGF